MFIVILPLILMSQINELALQSTIDLPVKMKLNNSISLEKGHHLIVIPMTLRYDYDDGAGETKSGLAQSSVSIPIVVPGKLVQCRCSLISAKMLSTFVQSFYVILLAYFCLHVIVAVNS